MNTQTNNDAQSVPSPSSLSDALRFDPFAGEMDVDSRVLSDKVVKCKKPSECHQCGEQINIGDHARSRSEICDGEFVTYKWCTTCVELMAADDEDAFEARCRVNA